MKHESKFHSQHEADAFTHTQAAQAQHGRQFASVEEMLRLDAEETIVPVAIAERLQTSTAAEPGRCRPWWDKLFRR